MPSTISSILSAGAVGTEVYGITDKGADAAAAAGYAAWVESITGTLPYVRNLGGGRAAVYLTESQAALMRAWMESKIQKSMLPRTGPPPTLEIEFSSVIKPIAIKYIAVFSALFFLTGWLTRGFIK